MMRRLAEKKRQPVKFNLRTVARSRMREGTHKNLFMAHELKLQDAG